MQLDHILLTGGTGNLGRKIVKSRLFNRIIAPTHQELDITKPETIESFFNTYSIDTIIHCAAFARVGKCEISPYEALRHNTLGTVNLVNAVLTYEQRQKKTVRFLHMSTDAVYAGTHGNYSETSPAIPSTVYGWTKLGAECAVNLLKNHCIIRTSFFNPENVPFDSAPTDAFCSKIDSNDLVQAIYSLVDHHFIGTVNIGWSRQSLYEIYNTCKPTVKPSDRTTVYQESGICIPDDSSLNCDLWKKISM